MRSELSHHALDLAYFFLFGALLIALAKILWGLLADRYISLTNNQLHFGWTIGNLRIRSQQYHAGELHTFSYFYLPTLRELWLNNRIFISRQALPLLRDGISCISRHYLSQQLVTHISLDGLSIAEQMSLYFYLRQQLGIPAKTE